MKRNLKEKIEETVVDLLNNHLDEDKELPNWRSPAGKSLVDAYTKQLLSLFSDTVDRIIGEDEEDTNFVSLGNSIRNGFRNKLRKEQRARKKEIGL